MNNNLSDGRKLKLIALIGLSGSGKTSVGQQLSQSIKLNFIDTDKLIEEKEKKIIPEIFLNHGEKYFRQLETQVLAEISLNPNFLIVATGAGLPCYNNNFDKLAKCSYLIYLKTNIDTLIKRLTGDGIANRPLLSNKTPESLNSILLQMLEEREKFYSQADIIIDTDKLSLADIAFNIQRKFLADVIWY